MTPIFDEIKETPTDFDPIEEFRAIIANCELPGTCLSCGGELEKSFEIVAPECLMFELRCERNDCKKLVMNFGFNLNYADLLKGCSK